MIVLLHKTKKKDLNKAEKNKCKSSALRIKALSAHFTGKNSSFCV